MKWQPYKFLALGICIAVAIHPSQVVAQNTDPFEITVTSTPTNTSAPANDLKMQFANRRYDDETAANSARVSTAQIPTIPQVIQSPDAQQIYYSGTATNTTYNVASPIYFSFLLDSTQLSGYSEFDGGLCGGGFFIGNRNGNQLGFSYVSDDPDSGCGFDHGYRFNFIGTLSNDLQTFSGSYDIPSANQRGMFSVARSEGPKFAISGKTITNEAEAIRDVTISINPGVAATSDPAGNYSILGLLPGVYSLSASKLGYTFTSSLRTVNVRADVAGVNFVGSPIVAALVSPNDGDSIGPATLQISASVFSTDVVKLEFFVFYDGIWKTAGTAASSPYQVAWQTPNALRSQLLRFRIDATLTTGKIQASAGGERRISFKESIGNSAVVENWVPARFYLNQRSLGNSFDLADYKCSATSMAMVLAMNGLVASDYSSMAAKANDMYPRVLISGTAYVYKMVAELKRQGASATYNDDLKRAISVQEGWQIIRREVDAGYPVIVRTAQGVVTPAGHILVAVGYQETGAFRQIIAYDPYGQWKGISAGDYYTNTRSPDSRVGQWVYYDFAKIFGDYLITARRNQMQQERTDGSPSSAPDVISDEPRYTGYYKGVQIVDSVYFLHMPAVRK